MSDAVPRETSVREARYPWEPDELLRLRRMKGLGISIDDMAEVLGRTPDAVRGKINELGIGRRYRKPVRWSRR